MKYTIDINCDVGEGIANDATLMPYLSSCSIACGAHAGNETIIQETIKLAIENGVKIGAHPSFPDKENFGRNIINISPLDLQMSIENQINLVKKYTLQSGEKLNHVKVHGALYNLSAVDLRTSKIIIDAFLNTTKNIFLYVPYNSVIEKLALKKNIKVKIEAFADRNYNDNLTLVSRQDTNAIITNTEKLSLHIQRMIIEKKVISINGLEIKMDAETFCIHGDNSNAKNLLKYLHKTLPKKGIKII